jgi:hypothetical protein
MSLDEFANLIKWATAIGMKYFSEIVAFKQKHNCRTNNELLNKLNEVFVRVVANESN